MGYELHLTGGFVESKSIVDEYLQLGWLDSRTKCFNVEFQMYTPDTDSVTIAKIRVTSEFGIFHAISTDVSKFFSNFCLS